MLYPREDAEKKKLITGTLLWRIKTEGPLKHGEGKKFCQYYDFNETTFSVVKSELEDSGILNGNGDFSLEYLKKIHNSFVDLLALKL